MLRGPDSAEWKGDLAKVEQRWQRLNADDTFLSAERDLEKLYFNHWRKKLRYLLAKQGLSFSESGEGPEDSPGISLNDVKPSDESWKVITPRILMRAVLKIREDFEHLFDAQRDFFRGKCFKDLHVLPTGTTEPVVFKNHFDGCVRKLQQILIYSFGRLLEISLSQEGLIGNASVHWASLHVTDLIEGEDRLVENWIKSVCDRPTDLAPANSEEFVHKVVFRTDWRAPRRLVMRPNGNAAYDCSTAWERMDESDTKRILKYLRESRWILLLESALTNVAGVAYETLAKRKAPAEKAQTKRPTPSTIATEGTPHNPHKPLILKYRSGIKLAILGALMKNPNASDAAICRSLDADGGEELPAGWKTRKEDRSFFGAYTNPRTKRKVEIAVSKIRRDLRDRGLLH